MTQAYQLKYCFRLLLNIKFALFERMSNPNSTRGNSRGCFSTSNGQGRTRFGFQRNSHKSNNDQDIDGYDDLNLLLMLLKTESFLFVFFSLIDQYCILYRQKLLCEEKVVGRKCCEENFTTFATFSSATV